MSSKVKSGEHKFTSGQRFQLQRWIDDKRERLEQEKPTLSQVAKEMMEDFKGWNISHSDVARARDAVEFKWDAQIVNVQTIGKEFREYRDQTEARIKALEARLAVTQ